MASQRVKRTKSGQALSPNKQRAVLKQLADYSEEPAAVDELTGGQGGDKMDAVCNEFSSSTFRSGNLAKVSRSGDRQDSSSSKLLLAIVTSVRKLSC